MERQNCIFYGVGDYLRFNIAHLVKNGYDPICFSDSDTRKHYASFSFTMTHGEILPPEVAFLRFPDAKILITSRDELYTEITQYLINSHCIDKNRIVYPVPVYFGYGCSEVGQHFVMASKITTCCYWKHELSVDYSESFLSDVKNYTSLAQKIFHGFLKGNHEPCCIGCPRLTLGVHRLNPEINRLNFVTSLVHDYCNARCIYCYSGNAWPEKRPIDNRRDYKFDAVEYAANHSCRIDYAAGEISCAEFCDELIDLLIDKNVEGIIYTNGFIFKDSIARYISTKKGTLFVSLDAGTRPTFSRIKGVDCFDRVLNNLRHYAKHGEIELKYILLDNINDNLDDINAFVNFASEIRAKTNLSMDLRKQRERLSGKEMDMARYFISLCKEKDLLLQVSDESFNENDLVQIKNHITHTYFS